MIAARLSLKLTINPATHCFVVPTILRPVADKMFVQKFNLSDAISAEQLPVNVFAARASAASLEGAEQIVPFAALSVCAGFDDPISWIIKDSEQTLFVDGFEDFGVHSGSPNWCFRKTALTRESDPY